MSESGRGRGGRGGGRSRGGGGSGRSSPGGRVGRGGKFSTGRHGGGGRGQRNASKESPSTGARGRGGGGRSTNAGRSGGRGPSGRGVDRANDPNNSISLSEEFCMEIQQQLQQLVDDPTQKDLSFSKSFDNTQRRYIHSMAEKYGLFSKSNGKGENRFIHVAKMKKTANMEKVSLRIGPIKVPDTMFPNEFFEPLQELQEEEISEGFEPYQYHHHNNTLGKSTKGNKKHRHHHHHRPTFPPLISSSTQTNSQNQNSQNSQNSQTQTNKKLPVFDYRDEILSLVDANPVVVISGDTGCGKSTQIPQFLLDDAIQKGNKNITKIICTQPRRISAISLAERVMKERGGVHTTEIGYAVRFDANFDPQKTQIIYATTGTLLKWLSKDPFCLGMSHLVLDEVHERDQFSDFLLILLKKHLLSDFVQEKRRQMGVLTPLKVVLMSATIQVDKFANYFDQAPTLEMHGRMFPVTKMYLEDILILLNGDPGITSSSTSSSTIMRGGGNTRSGQLFVNASQWECFMCGYTEFDTEDAFGVHVATCFGEKPPSKYNVPSVHTTTPPLSKKPVVLTSVGQQLANELTIQREKTCSETQEKLIQAYLMQENALSRDGSVDYELITQLVWYIDETFGGGGDGDDGDGEKEENGQKNNGSILIFLPGWEEITQLERNLLWSMGGDSGFTTTTVNTDRRPRGRPKRRRRLDIALLHSRLTPQEQRKAFFINTTPNSPRKVILSTNIAETSLTIEDVVFVIDCGKARQLNFIADASHGQDDSNLIGSACVGLRKDWISKANCLQRSGRAGRVTEGICFHLFSFKRFTSMKEFMTPELLVTPLEELILHLKLMLTHLDHSHHQLTKTRVKEFLLAAPDPPSEIAIDQSIQRLIQMEALVLTQDQKNQLEFTSLGFQLAHVSLPPAIGKMVLWAHCIGGQQVLDPILWSCCALGFREPFDMNLLLSREELTQLANIKKKFVNSGLLLSNQSPIPSDHYLMYKVLEKFLQVKGQRGKGSGRLQQKLDEFCRQNMLNKHTLDNIASISNQVKKELEPFGYLSSSSLSSSSSSKESESEENLLLMRFLTVVATGLYPNLVYTKVSTSSTSRNFTTKQKFKVKMDANSMVHLTSVQQEDTLEFVLFHEMMQSERTRIATYGTKISPWILLFFVGKQALIEEKQVEIKAEDHVQEDVSQEENTWVTKWFLVIDEWIVFEISSQKQAQQILQLRNCIQQIFHRHIQFHQQFHGMTLPPSLTEKEMDSQQKDTQVLHHIIQWLASFSLY